jgi:ComF family protein
MTAPPSRARAFAVALLDLVYPPRCVACDDALGSSGDEPFCPVCTVSVDPLPGGCARCGLPGDASPCPSCAADPPPFRRCEAAALMGGAVAEAIHALKYRDRPALARPLGAWLARHVALPAEAVVVPVPLARRRRLARGYDQAALLARSLTRAHRHRLLWPTALTRTHETAAQVGRSRRERLEAVRGAFRADGAVRGRSVVLVDDVVTTGATAAACAEALLEAGARDVSVVALARAE